MQRELDPLQRALEGLSQRVGRAEQASCTLRLCLDERGAEELERPGHDPAVTDATGELDALLQALDGIGGAVLVERDRAESRKRAGGAMVVARACERGVRSLEPRLRRRVVAPGQLEIARVEVRHPDHLLVARRQSRLLGLVEEL